ncbi:MAG: metallophosphoesterase [Candidatus Thorarchaeota archaeon]|nr:metallophosphoesterase [Candidatus Thorarchaeota archaeon]
MNPLLRKSVLKQMLVSGLQIAPDALDYICSLPNPYDALDAVIRRAKSLESLTVVEFAFVRDVIAGTEPDPTMKTPSDRQGTLEDEVDNLHNLHTRATHEETEKLTVIKNPELKYLGSSGQVEDFLALFRDRLQRLKKLYNMRVDTAGALSPGVAKTQHTDRGWQLGMSQDGERFRRPSSVTVIGMIREKSVSRSRNVVFEIEDADDSIVCVVPAARKAKDSNTSLARDASVILNDEVVCVSGYLDRDRRMIVERIIFPDVPTTPQARWARRDVYAAFVSDIHYGNKECLIEDFRRFLNWTRGVDVDSSDRELVEHLEYLFIAGDLCDGVGIYPGQENDLAIPDIYDQYDKFAQDIRLLPEKIQVVCIPGNHDVSRQALPRPPIPREFAEGLYEMEGRVHIMGDPCQIRAEGVSILITHGDALDDLVTQVPSATYRDPAMPMKELLRKRHLAPMYGGKTELAPLPRDWMVIEEVPSIVHFGHAHHNAVDNYRSVQIINSGTFQNQTEFMRKQGIVPTPGIVTLVNLRTGAPEVKVFHEY